MSDRLLSCLLVGWVMRGQVRPEGLGERRYADPITVFGEASNDKLRESWPALVNFLLERARGAA